MENKESIKKHMIKAKELRDEIEDSDLPKWSYYNGWHRALEWVLEK